MTENEPQAGMPSERLAESKKPRRRRWTQFGLRTFLVLVVVAGVAAGVWGARRYREQCGERAIAAIGEAGGKVLRNKAGGVRRVHLQGKKRGDFTDETIAELAPHLYYLPDLVELDLVKNPITDAGLLHLKKLKQLKELYVFETDVTDAGIAALQRELPDLVIKQEKPAPYASGMAGIPIYNHALNTLAMRSDGRQFVAGNGAGELLWWDGASGSLAAARSKNPLHQNKTKSHGDWLFGIAYSPDHQRLATGGGDDLIKLWDPKLRTKIGQLKVHTDDVHAVAFAPDGQSIYSVSDDMTVVRTWFEDSESGIRQQRSLVLGRHPSTIPCMALDPSGKILASGSRDDTIVLWNAEQGGVVRSLRGHTDDVMSIAFSKDGQTLVSGSYDGTVRLWDVETGESLGVMSGHKDRVFAVAISRDGRTIASGGDDGMIIWERDSFSQRRHTQPDRKISCLRFTADDMLVTSDISGRIRFIHPVSGSTLRSISTSRVTVDGI